MFPFLKKGRRKKETILVIDVGSGSIAAAVVNFNYRNNPEVLHIKRLPIPLISELAPARLKREALKTLEEVLKNLNDSIGKSGEKISVNEAHCMLASPWFNSEIKVVRHKENKSFVVNSKFVADLLKEEESSVAPNGSEVIERKVTNVRLNGYKVNEPLGKRTTEVDFNLFISFAPSNILNGIENTIAKHFAVGDTDFHSFTLTSFGAVRDMYEKASSFLLLDITGEVTDISLIKSDDILKTVSFPLGRNTLIREVSKTLKTSIGEGTSSIRLFISDSLSRKRMKVLEKALEKPRKAWIQEFQQALFSLSDGVSLPSTVFFTADDDIASLYNDAIKKEEFAQSSITNAPFVVSLINKMSLEPYVSFKGFTEKDIFIGLAAIYLSKLFELKG